MHRSAFNARRIGSVTVEARSRESAIQLIRDALESPRPNLISFCNAHTVNLAASDPDFANFLKAFVIFNDGLGVDIASRILYGEPFPANLVGTDFVPELLNATCGLRVFLLGSATPVVEEARRVLRERHPEHRFVGTHHGFFTEDEESAVIAKIRSAAPDLILVGMGQPKQEKWSARNLHDVPAVTMCVGAFLEFSAGSFRRAPSWVRAARLEWAYRLALEPRRLATRYLVGNATFMARVFRDRAKQMRSFRRKPRKC